MHLSPSEQDGLVRKACYHKPYSGLSLQSLSLINRSDLNRMQRLQVKRQTLIGCSALAVGAITVIINPRVNISEETFVLISCTTRQIVMVNRTEPDSQSYTVANGIYSVEELVDSIYGQAEQKMEIELSGNMFAGLARGLITSLRPVRDLCQQCCR